MRDAAQESEGPAPFGQGHFSPPFDDFGLDANGNGLYDFLVVTANVTIDIADNYTVDGFLNRSNSSFFLYNGTTTYLGPGSYTIPVFYDGPAINSSGVDGPYSVLLNLWDGSGSRTPLDSANHATGAYNHTEFDARPAEFTSPHSDAGIDSDGDGRFNALDVNASLTVNLAGEYYINAFLYDADNAVNMFLSLLVTFDPGPHTVVFPFSGRALNESGADGPYFVYMNLYSTPEYQPLDVAEHTTAPYNHLEFEEPAAMQSSYAPFAPTIDGRFTTNEWANAHVEDLTAIPGNEVPTSLLVMNDENFLYVAYDAFGDTASEPQDVAAIAFDTGNDGLMTINQEDEFVQGGWAPNNQAHYVFQGNTNWTISDSPFNPNLPNQGGLAAAWGFGPSPAGGPDHRIYEFKIPLSLLALQPGDTIGFFGGSHAAPGVFDNATFGWSGWPDWSANPIPLASYGDLTLAIRGDDVPPTITIVSPAPDNVSLTDSVTVTWNASDEGSGLDRFEVRVDNGAAIPRPLSPMSYEVANLSDGPHTIVVTAYDRVNNPQSASVQVIVDATPPSIDITSPLDGRALDSPTVVVTWSAANAGTRITGYAIQLDGESEVRLPDSSANYSFDGLSEGAHQVHLTVFDAVGRSTTAASSFTVDVTAPTVTIDAPSGGFLGASTVAVSWTAADVGSGLAEFDVVLDNATPSTLPGSARSHSFPSVSDGPHTIQVTAIDAAGNSASATPLDVTIDTAAPIATITAPESGSVVPSSGVTVSFTVTDGAGSGIDRIEIALDRGPATPVGASATSYSLTGLPQGDHRVDVTAFDRVGNSRTVTVTFRVDLAFLSPSGPYGYAGLGIMAAVLVAGIVAAVAIVHARRKSGPRDPIF